MTVERLSWDAVGLFQQTRISPASPAVCDHDRLTQLLRSLASQFSTRISLATAGYSFERRAIHRVTIGRGPTTLLLWTQMHGDEPTHTLALLDVLHLLATQPDGEPAAAILQRCTLHALLMLNPDGAARNQRRNAQGIDINRDAVRRQTVEGRLLWETVAELRPDFAFNLHNQNPRASAGPTRFPAAIALLAPPVDASHSQPPHVQRAKSLAAHVVTRLETEFGAMMARYDADFMPTAFGEAIQQTGAATMLIEAGGWPAGHPDGLTELHFRALLHALHGIATGDYLRAPASTYDRLPLSGGRTLVDVKIEGCRWPTNAFVEPIGDASRTNVATQPVEYLSGDLAINFAIPAGGPGDDDLGLISDCGDLRDRGAKHVHAGDGCLVLAGGVAFQPDLRPDSLSSIPELARIEAWQATVLIGLVDLADADAVERFANLDPATRLPLHVGFIAWVPEDARCGPAALQERLLRTIASGCLGCVATSLDDECRKYCSWFRIPRIAREVVWGGLCPAEVAKQLSLRRPSAGPALGWGHLRLQTTADLRLVEASASGAEGNPARLRTLFLGGEAIWHNGRWLRHDRGRLIEGHQSR